MNPIRTNPPELFDSEPVGFSQMVVTTVPYRSISLSGQVAWNADREIVGRDDMYTQVVQSLRNIESALSYANASLGDVVALRLYIKQSHIHDSDPISRGLKDVFGDKLPCATWIGVSGLADEAFLIEIEPTVVPSDSIA